MLKNFVKPGNIEQPIRGEIFSAEKFEQFAAALAKEHKAADQPKRYKLLRPRLKDNGKVLLGAYYSLANAIREERSVSPAAEWLVDNFHIVEEQLREIHEDLPPGYYRELPKLANGEFAGYPRIYAIAMSIIAHTDSRLDVEALERFLRSYQAVTPLTIGELWAIAITLRIVLIENLRRFAWRIIQSREAREEAEKLADELMEIAGKRPEEVLQFVTQHLDKRTEFETAFVERFTCQLRDRDLAIAPAYEWLANKLHERGSSIELSVETEYQLQAVAQVTVGNIITSMRLLSTIDWRTFFESVSLIDPLFSKDPAKIYSKMTFGTRNRYREVVERIARRTKADELRVARKVVEKSQGARRRDASDRRRSHIGFYLIDKGVSEIEKEFQYRPEIAEKLVFFILRHPTFSYLGSAAVLTALVVLLLAYSAAYLGAGLPLTIAFAVLSIIPASDLALSVLNWDFARMVPPRILPQIDTTTGIPDEARTFVVIPTLLSSPSVVAELLEKLEVYSLANQDNNLYFALLTDFSDALAEELAEDSEIIKAARDGIKALNQKYEQTKYEKFYLFHRRRQWNEGEQKWMGSERKRGKLEEFNTLLRGDGETSYTEILADKKFLKQIKYVITLDSDTQLPRDAAHSLIGIAVHPLNRPKFDENLQRVIQGYAILQPRISISLQSASRSYFARIFSGNTGIDPYTTAASDVYQDLFGEGSFVGKGLYDVDAFRAALKGRVPENSLLSHDLFEGLYARCGLVSDVELLDDFPAHYDSFTERSHRWVRGDWQIARWIFPWIKNANGKSVRNDLSAISRWKILDNLRRSLVAPAIFLWLLAVWTVIPGSPLLWTLFIIVVLAFPVYAHLQTNLLTHPRGIPWTSHFWTVLGDVRTNTLQVLFLIVVLAHQAHSNCDAIVRTLYRKIISHKALLEWKTAAQSERERPHGQAALLWSMWASTLLSLIAVPIVFWFRPSAGLAAGPFLLLWVLAPFVAYRISFAPRSKQVQLSMADARMARSIARRTWRFFETFVGDNSNWLPPDNFQEDPQPKIAHRTSPTNIGLYFLSTISAYDLGYIGVLELIERLGFTFATLEKLVKVRGHYLNWYDTQSLAPLSPRYISTVDSGNLAGHLLAVKQAVTEIAGQKLFRSDVIDGLSDTLELIREEAKQFNIVSKRTEAVTIKQLQAEIGTCVRLLASGPHETTGDWVNLSDSLIAHAVAIGDIIGVLSQEHGEADFHELRSWSNDLSHQTQRYRQEISTLIPWQERDISHLFEIIGPNFPAIRQELGKITELLKPIPPLSELPELYEDLRSVLLGIEEGIANSGKGDPDPAAALKAIETLLAKLKTAEQAAQSAAVDLNSLAAQSAEIVDEMKFDFLFDEQRKIFSIGYNVDLERRDNSYYDLLASEARLTSFVAIAKDEIAQEHWFRLGRPLTPVDSSRALVSWTGTMFEYLMPILVMRDVDGTLLNQTYKAVVTRQIEYGAQNKIPWGMSESAYNARDMQLNYQYRAFGVPGLGLIRGLSEDLVIAPYATALGALVSPQSAMENFRHLVRENTLSRYGFYESIDYTPLRLPPGKEKAVVLTYMAHHQGMIMVALNNLINRDIMQDRFHTEPLVQATELLLQERIPQGAAAWHPRAEEVLSGSVNRQISDRITRTFDTPDLTTPRVQIVSNGSYSVMVTNSGAGYSMYNELAVTRWREDTTRDSSGSFIYLRDIASGDVWSAGHQPVGKRARFYEVSFSEDKAVIRRRDNKIATTTEIIVSPEDSAEIRRVSITNNGPDVREIEITSYSEIVLAPRLADAAHPAFSNLSIETEFNSAESSLIAQRRPRTETDEVILAVHTIATDGDTIGAVQYETDRSRFLGRGHDTREPVAVVEDRPLSNTVGAVLDPIFSLRRCIRVKPRETVRISFATAVAHSYDEAMRLADKYCDVQIFEREAALAWTRAQVEMRHLKIDPENAYLFQRLAAHILYSDAALRARSAVLALNTKAQSDLWAYGIGGDLPIVLIRINRGDDLAKIKQILRAHEYLRLKGLIFDLLILNDLPSSYLQSLHDELLNLVRTTGQADLLDKNGGIFIKRSDQIPEADRILLHTVARVVIVADRGNLEDEILRRPVESKLPKDLVARSPQPVYSEPPSTTPDLSFFNGLGGFGNGGREYVTILDEGQRTPAPWLNVIANDQSFGFQVSETGSGFTWSINSRENRLTPWSNDAVSDPPGEMIYLRDEETGAIWTPTPLPIREAGSYTITHGHGYSKFAHISHGVEHELTLFVPLDGPVKISLLRLRNQSKRKRKLTVTNYNELVLGFDRSRTVPYVVTETSVDGRYVRARNRYNNEFAERVAFIATDQPLSSLTCDRKEFIGRNGNLRQPAALGREKLSGRVGAGLDPCAALQTTVELDPDAEIEMVFLIGEAGSDEEVDGVVSRFRELSEVKASFDKVVDHWEKMLGTIEIRTPDIALNTLVNRWLLYQTLACRVWARSAFYQSGGAFGFRDQLQDVMSLVYAKPKIAREQILIASARQFKEGDVQHWWHPPTGRGVRTRISDDLLWLPFVASFYIKVTGDASLLDEVVPFIEAPLLKDGETDSYTQPTISSESATVLEHCLRAIDRSIPVGIHGLPLMGSGDWNDGMNFVGHEGKGESVWVGWFLLNTLNDVIPLLAGRNEADRESKYREHVKDLKTALEENAWDGNWYRRAYFDDGTALGSAENDECRIDSIAQAWSVISGGGNLHQATRAMTSVDEYLIRPGDGLVLLFTPPFDKGKLNPGYIKGYLPGVRENGGQYTHAAMWTIIAYALLGDGDKVGELFSLLNPINHTGTRAGLHKYKVEPYVLAGDVYSEPQHIGRGGWTWYTGSASWMYRTALESMLGFHLRGEKLTIDPCIPRGWRDLEIDYRHGDALYQIKVENPSCVCRGVAEVRLDSKILASNEIPLTAHGQTHQVLVVLGEPKNT
ncbi:MAG: phosphorylase [Acidobacteria bacterium]|nr:phosphorylase [Acidobacteriota bacterium]